MSRIAMRLAPAAALVLALSGASASAQIGEERAIPAHLSDVDLATLTTKQLLGRGRALFQANWTAQEGAGRPATKGNGNALSDPADPLVFPRSMNRISAPDANSCAGCHNLPFAGGGGDFVANVFVLGQRFDFATFSDTPDGFTNKGTTDAEPKAPTLQEVANSRNTLGMFGSGYIENLAIEITRRLQAIRDAAPADGSTVALVAKGIDFGALVHNVDDSWDVSGVEGLPAPSLTTSIGVPPSLVVRPFHQAGNVISVRQFTNNAMNHHHGIQTVERFGSDDDDGDGFTDEMTVADVTACSLYQAALQPPGRVIPQNPEIEAAIELGEDKFVEIGCAECHIPCLPLEGDERVFVEPNPFNPSGNLQQGVGVTNLTVDLNSKKLPGPRLRADSDGVTWVPCFTDFKLHDITTGNPGDPNIEALDMNQPADSGGFFAGNAKFLTRKLWGIANEPPFYHHGMYTTIREAVEAHAGEAAAAKAAYDALSGAERDAVIEFLKTLQVLPQGAKGLIVDQKGKKRKWRDFPYDCTQHLDPQD